MIKILKFGATWCNPCKALANTLKEVDLPIISYDVDEEDELATKYDVISIPVLIFVNEEGKEVDRLLGAVSKQAIIDKYNELNA